MSENGSDAMIGTKGAGTVTVKASLGGLSGTAKLTIPGNPPDLWEAGRARYQDGEQIRNDVAYHHADVTVVAVGGGLAYGALGMSHHATEDLAIMRSIPGLAVAAPGDAIELSAVLAEVLTDGVRQGRWACPDPQDTAARLVAVLDGIGLHVTMHGEDVPPGRAAASPSAPGPPTASCSPRSPPSPRRSCAVARTRSPVRTSPRASRSTSPGRSARSRWMRCPA